MPFSTAQYDIFILSVCVGFAKTPRITTAKVGIIPVTEEDAQQKNAIEVKKVVGFVEFYETRGSDKIFLETNLNNLS
jgi:hypothetical protein